MAFIKQSSVDRCPSCSNRFIEFDCAAKQQVRAFDFNTKWSMNQYLVLYMTYATISQLAKAIAIYVQDGYCQNLFENFVLQIIHILESMELIVE